MSEAFFDLETQYLFQELGMLDFKSRDPRRLKLAVAGVLADGKHVFFGENEASQLLEALRSAELIVGYNIAEFDYLVLQPYTDENVAGMLKGNTFDMFTYLRVRTGCWISLDDLCRLNLGIVKSEDTLEIPRMWREGKHDRVRSYLLNDLKMTEAIFSYGRRAGQLRYDHKEYGKSLGERVVAVQW